MLCGRRGDFAAQEAQFREVLTLQERDLGPEHPTTLSTRRNLANSLMALNRLEEAEAILAQTIVASGRVMGENHPDTLLNAHDRARCVFRLGRLKESEDLLKDTLAREEEALGPSHVLTSATRSVLTDVLVFANRFGEVEKYFAELASTSEEIHGSNSSRTLKYRVWLAICAAEQGRPESARSMLDQVGRIEAGEQSDVNFLRMRKIAEAKFRWLAGEFEQAETQLMEVGRELAPGQFDVHAHVARQYLAQLYKAWNRPDEAARWKAATVFEKS
jgi:tetratricopeptide (TPR) repeat protein